MNVIFLFVFLIFPQIWTLSLSFCRNSICKIENNCKCSGTRNPLNNGTSPQLVAITVSESIVTTLYETYWKPLLFNRKNPDGNYIGASFYINHEYTNYELVQKLYNRGFEIGVHSITKNSSQKYWREATKTDLIEEFNGQRLITSKFASIPLEDITGARTPQLQLEGDISIEAYVQSNITYDNSWPTLTNKRLYPYTLDYKSTQSCTVTMICPRNSYPGFWIAPLTNIKGSNDVECNSLATCGVEGSAKHISNWLLGELNRSRHSNRAPLVIRLDSYWFQFTSNSFEGFSQFLDQIGGLNDVFLVSVKDVIEWVKNPVAANMYKTPNRQKRARCDSVNCPLKNKEGNFRYMQSCVPCPAAYPWKGNPMGNNV